MLFENIPVDGGISTIHSAYECIEKRIHDAELSRSSWSMVELKLDSSDYSWVTDWASRLSPEVLRSYLQGRRHDAEFGLVFLLFCTEVARREVHPGMIWEPIRKRLSQSASNYLFPNIAPRVIEAAARRFNLRHVFDVEGGKNWMITVHLQFGLYYASLDKLTNWLRGFGAPDAMEHLLGYTRVKRLASDSFKRLFRDLKYFHQKKIVRSELLRRIADCPWVLPEHTEALLSAASKASMPTESLDSEPTRIPPFLGPATLRPGSNGPEFYAQLINLDAQPWEGGYAEVYVGDQQLGTLLQNDEGSWYLLDGDAVRLPTEGSTCHVICRDANNNHLGDAEVELWDQNNLVTLFQSDGTPLPATHPVSPGKSYWVLISAKELTVEPEPTQWYAFGTNFRLYSVSPTDSTPLRVLHGDVELWLSKKAGSIQSTTETPPPSIKAEFERSSVKHPSEHPYITLRLPNRAKLLFVRALGFPLEITENPPEWRVGPLPCIAGRLSPSTKLWLGYELDGEIKTSSLELSRDTLPLCGGIGFHQNIWQDCRSIAACTITEAEKLPLRIFPELTDTGYLFEGAAWVGKFHKDRRKHPYGWGGKLYLHRRLYNLVEEGDRIKLVHEITDPGEIGGIHWDSGKLTLTLRGIRELDPERHRLTAWLPDHSIHTIPAEKESHWSVPPQAIVLSCEGQRIGAWWADGWEESLMSLTVVESGEIAAFLRWAQLPLLRQSAQSALGQLLDRLPGRVLRAWLLDEFLPNDLYISHTEVGWREVVGTLLHSWNLTPDHIPRLCKQLGGESGDPWIVADRLRTISPVVAARFLKMACPNRPPQSLHADWGIAAESELLKQIEQLKDDGLGIDSGMIEHRSSGLRAIACQWRDNPETLENHQRMNLITATFTLRPFCDLLTLDILEGRL